ncbi:hypothetical protein AK812_SmicGene113 [Symbiodinium microadriaticum]|uniref:Uncharacterized protein n=1 Tax=Symbiodinium microadriaticum TaxID=2951 RepID=A0A1Q9F7G2_SYMMI|nr:hypothetical protein AK812_SmicGene113 [Symbiodinium microadriaticum]
MLGTTIMTMTKLVRCAMLHAGARSGYIMVMRTVVVTMFMLTMMKVLRLMEKMMATMMLLLMMMMMMMMVGCGPDANCSRGVKAPPVLSDAARQWPDVEPGAVRLRLERPDGSLFGIFTVAELRKAFKPCTKTVTHQCSTSGNVNTKEWTGVRVSELLPRMGIESVRSSTDAGGSPLRGGLSLRGGMGLDERPMVRRIGGAVTSAMICLAITALLLGRPDVAGNARGWCLGALGNFLQHALSDNGRSPINFLRRSSILGGGWVSSSLSSPSSSYSCIFWIKELIVHWHSSNPFDVEAANLANHGGSEFGRICPGRLMQQAAPAGFPEPSAAAGSIRI